MANPTRTPSRTPNTSPNTVDPESATDWCRVQIDRIAHKLLDPSLGRERAGYIAVDIWLWFTKRRAAAPEFLNTPEDFDRGVRRKLKDEVRKVRKEAAKYDDSTDIDELLVERGGGSTRVLRPDEVLAQSETIWHVQRAIAQLPPQMQRVIRLYDLREWTAEEVGIELGMTTASVRLIRHRAKERLREILGSFGDLEAA
jgi:hypothetical protein